MRFLELVKARNDPGFEEWVAGRPELSEAEYRSGQVMAFLGVQKRSYQYWEAHHETLGYPVPNPGRRPLWEGGRVVSRYYTVEEVEKIAYWYYQRKVKDEESHVFDAAAG